MNMKYIVLFWLFPFAFPLWAQTPVEKFTLINVVDNAPVSLDGCAGCKGVAVIFTSTVCPYDQYYLGRIKDLINTYEGKIQFLLVNSCPEPEESAENMKNFQTSRGLTVPYLADKDQVAMNALGARRSPEVFLLQNVNNKQVVIYNGALDDNPQVANAVTRNYLKSAIDKLLAGQEIETPVSRAAGCSIRKK